jgi:hypothetical protein
MTERPRWTTPAEIVARVKREWARGGLFVPDASLFPWELKLRRPDARGLSAHFDEARQWIRDLERAATVYEIRWSELNHRQLGRQRVPEAVVIGDAAGAYALLGVEEQVRAFQKLEASTLPVFPELQPWLAQHPFDALTHELEWPRILSVLSWMRAHPQRHMYLRQLEIPGVDSKFIEAHKGLLSDLLDLVLSPAHMNRDAHPTRQFEQRYGLRVKQPLVRFRVLDSRLRIGSLDDIAVPADQFARLSLPVSTVFVTENEINGLAFPACTNSIVVFGLGYGLARLSEVEWLQGTSVYYWGDIDTHGFAMLDRLRAGVPHARSFLMDRETLQVHQSLWSHEAAPYRGELGRLTAPELSLYEDLRADRLGAGVRLEQERVGYGWLRRALQP